MANYEIDPKILIPYVPKGVDLDFFNGKCYISLVGFMFKNTRLFNLTVPFFGNFEEINLRFYVKRIEGDKVKRGVVFINETIPYPIVAWIANKLYNEHYSVVPTRNQIVSEKFSKKVKFEWLLNNKWNSISVMSALTPENMIPNSIENFIYEHYYGYTKTAKNETQEYKLQHPSWKINEVLTYQIECDFEEMYGKSFSILNKMEPETVFIAEGSAVGIEWKRTKLNLNEPTKQKLIYELEL
jgi:uncharacterized protein YqjF (DUF2071 family)